MDDHVEEKLRLAAIINNICYWILAIIVFVWVLAAEFKETGIVALFLAILLGGCILLTGYVGSWILSAFADITENTRGTNQELRQLNINIQKAFLSNIQATERTIAEETHLERERTEQRRKEAERVEAEKKREAARRKEAYWQEHSKEKDMLLAKREEAEKALRTAGKLPAKEKSQLEELIQKIDTELNRER